MREALPILPGACQDILDRFFARDQGYKTIADELEIPSGTIASGSRAASESLQEELEGRNEAPRGVKGVGGGSYDEERLGVLLRILPPAPTGWVRAAPELPARSPRVRRDGLARREGSRVPRGARSPVSSRHSRPKATSRAARILAEIRERLHES